MKNKLTQSIEAKNFSGKKVMSFNWKSRSLLKGIKIRSRNNLVKLGGSEPLKKMSQNIA